MTQTAKRRGRRLWAFCLIVVALAGAAALWRSRLTAIERTLVGQWHASPAQGRLELSFDRRLRWVRDSSPTVVGRWKVVGDRLIVEPPPQGHPPLHRRILESLRQLTHPGPRSTRWPPLNLRLTQVKADSFIMTSPASGTQIHWRRQSLAGIP